MDTLMSGLAAYGEAVSRHAAVVDKLLAERMRAVDDWVAEYEDEIWELADEDQDLAGTLEDELRDFAATGTQAALSSWPAVRHTRLTEEQASLAPRLESISKRMADADEPVRERFEEAKRRLEAWTAGEHAPPAALEAGWRTVLPAWRASASLSTREAAHVLGVSAPTIVRHSRGDRTPTRREVIGFVRRIIDAGPLPMDADKHRAVRSLQAVIGDSDGTSADILDGVGTPPIEVTEYVDRLERAADSLTRKQLEALTVLAEQPGLLDALVQGAARLHEQPLVVVAQGLASAGIVPTLAQQQISTD